MGKTTTNILSIIDEGSNIIVDAKEKTSTNLMEIVKLAVKKNVNITIKNAESKTTTNLIELAKIGGKNLTIDLS